MRVGSLISMLLLATLSLSVKTEIIHRGSSDGHHFVIERIAQDLGIPWGMAFVTPDSMLVTQRAGTLVLLDITDGSTQPVDGLPEILVSGQGGLLDVRTPPRSFVPEIGSISPTAS